MWDRVESQSLPLFRAFQLEVPLFDHQELKSSRNPFLYSGHFNTASSWNSALHCFQRSRNPFLYSGHFNKFLGRLEVGDHGCRNPFLYSGHFNEISFDMETIIEISRSQSLLLFRAFQLDGGCVFTTAVLWDVAIPSFIQGISTSW